MELLSALNPGIVLIIAGLIACLVPQQRVRQALVLAAPVLGLVLLALATRGVDLAPASVLGLDLSLYRVDRLGYIFALAFLIAAVLNAVYALHSDDRLQDGTALIYAGGAVGAALSGDLVTLFVFWEITAVSSVFLIFRASTQAAYNAGMRYLAIQILSGVLLLDGIAYVYKYTGSLSLEAFSSFDAPGAKYVFVAFAIKAAFPLVHNWLHDAYPKASIVGAVVLSAFTTKLAVYAFARMFPGFETLIIIGAVMAVFPLLFTVLENDLRRVLSYALNSQIGFMICAIGVGTPLALNGAAAHAFACTIYMGLLFMAIGAVLQRTGSAKVTDLGGLWASMPWTTLACLFGALSIAALPLTNGFAAKALTMGALSKEGHSFAWLALTFASAGVVLHAGLKVPYAAFFAPRKAVDRAVVVREAPFNMLLAMGLAALICIATGLPSFVPGFGYDWLYGLLPEPDSAKGYTLFTLGHVLTQLQLLSVAALVFMLAKRFGIYPNEVPSTILDTDWLYRKPGYGLAMWSGTVWAKLGPALTGLAGTLSGRAFSRLEAAFSPRGTLARGGLTSGMAIWSTVLLGVVMLVVLLS
ncbi:MAG: Na(+)/H(+) antiporter subunit D [Pseudomonadota bacterium]